MPVTVGELIEHLHNEPDWNIPVGLCQIKRPEGVTPSEPWFSLYWALREVEEGKT